jgi:hypothetical protein
MACDSIVTRHTLEAFSEGTFFCHATEKSEVIPTCKEMPVILVNQVVDKKRIIGKRMAEEEERHGVADPKRTIF